MFVLKLITKNTRNTKYLGFDSLGCHIKAMKKVTVLTVNLKCTHNVCSKWDL